MVTRIEGQEPEFPNEGIRVPETRRARIGRPCDDDSYNGHEDVEPDSCPGASSGLADTVRKADAENLATEETNVVDNKGGETGLIDNVAPAVDGRGA